MKKIFVATAACILFHLASFAQDTTRYEVIQIETQLGNMVVWLYDETPKHKANFLKLAANGDYNNTCFHRVIRDFMIQGGDPNSKDTTNRKNWGQGGPGYTVPAEFNKTLIHKKGALAGARMPDNVNPNRESSGSQFYIVEGRTFSDEELTQMETYIQNATKDPLFHYTPEQKEMYKTLGGTPHLDLQYTVFGEVISGLEFVDPISILPTVPPDRPKTDFSMQVKVVKYTADQLQEKFGFSIPGK